MVYRYFDKKANGSVRKLLENLNLNLELLPIIRKFKKRKVHSCKKLILLCIQHIMKENFLLLKDLLGH